jgi:hypothetical protein
MGIQEEKGPAPAAADSVVGSVPVPNTHAARPADTVGQPTTVASAYAGLMAGPVENVAIRMDKSQRQANAGFYFLARRASDMIETVCVQAKVRAAAGAARGAVKGGS